MRITARVTDVESGEVVTTVKVDGSRRDLFALQDRVVTELDVGTRSLASRSRGRDATRRT